jgi:hypothetical protein
MDAVRQIADAVLYEGYVLWPYRRSALKNRQRWTFGGVYPRDHSEGREDDPWRMRVECLLLDGDAMLDVRVRFLHVVRRQVMQASANGLRPVDELTVAGERYLSWEEAIEREAGVGPVRVSELAKWPRRVKIAIPRGQVHEDLGAEGAIVRSWQRLDGCVEIGTARLPVGARRPAADVDSARGLFRVTVRVANTTPWHGGSREQAVERTLCSTHAVLRAEGGEFVSLTDPPDELRAAAEACRNDGVWPVLVGEPGERSTLLASPIILEDHPRIAPESPGDLFDGGEIDQLLVLNILSLTEEEKAEMRDSDPRAREILERTEALTDEQLMRLHGAIREFGLTR